MAEIDYDKLHEFEERLEGEVHDLVDREIIKAGLTGEEEEFLRNRLTDEFRFWKRLE